MPFERRFADIANIIPAPAILNGVMFAMLKLARERVTASISNKPPRKLPMYMPWFPMVF